MDSATMDAKQVREPAYAQRLEQACDGNPHCPPMNKGRLNWLVEQLAKRKVNVAFQSVARWLKGEARPRKDKNDALATVLNVDAAWLYFGIEHDITPRERKVRNAMADGAVNLIAGLIQMDGGYPAFPEEKDARAQREHVDLYAVIKGVNYAFHVTLGKPQSDGWQFAVPVEHENVVVLGVVRDGFSLRIAELTDDVVEENGKPSGRSVTVTLTEKAFNEQQITTFGRRL